MHIEKIMEILEESYIFVQKAKHITGEFRKLKERCDRKMKGKKSAALAVMGAVVISTCFNAYGAWGRRDIIDHAVSVKGIMQFSSEAFFSGAYLGTWWDLYSQRCSLDITAMGDNQFRVNINWSGGAYSGTEWTMTAQYDNATGYLNYQDGREVVYEYNDMGARQDQVVYADGSGRFYISNGYLYWIDEKEHSGDACYFEKDNSSPASGEAYNGNSLYVEGCDISITLRNAPSTNAAEITQIPVYTAVNFIGSADNGFSQVSYNGQTGYVLSAYLDTYEPQVYTGVKCTVTNCRTSITLRTSASANAKEIVQIPLGATVDYIESSVNGFYLVNYNGKIGYAKSDYLAFQ